MKANRSTRQNARRLLQACYVGDQLQLEKVSALFTALQQNKPRGFMALVYCLHNLFHLEVNRRTHSVQTAIDLPDHGAGIFAELTEKFGAPLRADYQVVPALLGGLRIQVGSDVWDGTIKQKLRLINPTLN